MQVKRCQTMKQGKGKIMKTSDHHLLAEELRAAGFTLAANGPHLRVAPADSLTDELRARIRENKAELLALLADPVKPPQAPEAVQSTTDATPAPTMQPRARKGPFRASSGKDDATPVNDAHRYGGNGVPILMPQQTRCADCVHVAPPSGQAAAVRRCKIIGTHFDVDHHALIWGFRIHSCSRFEAAPVFAAHADHVIKGYLS